MTGQGNILSSALNCC